MYDFSEIIQIVVYHIMGKNETRQNILSAARTAFVQYGYEKTAMEDIANLANRAKTSIYYYFDNKDEIFKTVVEQECESIRAKLEPYTVLEGQMISVKLRDYLKKRVELITSSELFKQISIAEYSDINLKLGSLIHKGRESMDIWEKEFFIKICNLGKASGILNSEINPEQFASIFEMLLKSIEVQFVISENRSELKSTYEAMIDFIIPKVFNY